MGLAWQQGPLATGSVGYFLTPQPLPQRLLFVEPLRRRMRVRLGDRWIADSEGVVLLHEPGRYPVAYFPRDNIQPMRLIAEERLNNHPVLGKEPDKIDVYLDGQQLHLEPGQTVVSHGVDRGLDPDEILQNSVRSQR
jgi:hypothetical protein